MLAISSSVSLFAGMMPDAPRRFFSPGYLIDSYKYASSAVTTVPSLSVTCESARPTHFGPTRPSPFSPWQLAQPAVMLISRPAAASGERSTGALEEVDEHDATNTDSATIDTTENFDHNLFAIPKQYLCRQVEFGIVVKTKW